MNMLRAIGRHKWRYLTIVAGLFLFVAPAALFVRLGLWCQGSGGKADVHDICYRMPFAWLAGGSFASFNGRYFLLFFLGSVLGTSFFFGPLFCGWLCPVGSSTELASKPVPRRFKIDLRRKISPSALRYGFLGSFVLVSALTVFTPSLGLASICCRYCASTQVQNMISGIFNPAVLTYWSSGSIMALGGWLFLGGVFWQGGRGWCLYGCPLGAVSNVLHTAGSKLGFTYKVKYDPANCAMCGKCEGVCPIWAISKESREAGIDRSTCNTCLECVKTCDKGCYSYERGTNARKTS